MICSQSILTWSTAAVLTDDSLAAFEEIRLVVVEEEGPESGRIAQSTSGLPLRVATSAARERFEQMFLTILNRQQ